jgi:hypothetical protein
VFITFYYGYFEKIFFLLYIVVIFVMICLPCFNKLNLTKCETHFFKEGGSVIF